MEEAENEDYVPRASSSTRLLARFMFTVVGLAALGLVAAFLLARRSSGPDIGELVETLWELPPEIGPPAFVEVTDELGLAALRLADRSDPMAGGSAIGDLNGDGDLDLVVANGQVVVLLRDGDAYLPPINLGLDKAMAVTLSDVDRDGWLDVLVARDGDSDTIVCGEAQASVQEQYLRPPIWPGGTQRAPWWLRTYRATA